MLMDSKLFYGASSFHTLRSSLEKLEHSKERKRGESFLASGEQENISHSGFLQLPLLTFVLGKKALKTFLVILFENE
jgi:hypothetical protein